MLETQRMPKLALCVFYKTFSCLCLFAFFGVTTACGESSHDESDDPDTEESGQNSGAEDTEDDSKGDSDEDASVESAESGEKESVDNDEDPMPWFTFFTTSQEGLVSLASDKEKGLGGDLGGLAGADEICAKLAKVGNPGDKKTWVAFLSATQGGRDGGVVHAIERIGEGPWHDFNHRLLAEDVEGLLPRSDREGRPKGADPQLAEMLTDEKGRPISPNTKMVDNHDMLTGSNKEGRLPEDATLRDTCQDWTSKDPDGNDKPQIGHAWPRNSRNGRHWIADHRAGGCGAGMDTKPGGSNGTPTVGSGGGYGGFYCFAVNQ